MINNHHNQHHQKYDIFSLQHEEAWQYVMLSFQVYVGDIFCGQVTYQAGQSIYEIPCIGAVGSFVKILKDGILTLCEVQAWGGRKSGLNKFSQ